MPSIQLKITMHPKKPENRIHNPEHNLSADVREITEPADKDGETVIRKRNEVVAWKGED